MANRTESTNEFIAVAKPEASNELRIVGDPNQTSEQRMAKTALGPTAASAVTAVNYAEHVFGVMSLTAAHDMLNSSVKAVQDGDMREVEAVLVAQAAALNSIFNTLAMRACKQDSMKFIDGFLRLALKAQSQSRATLETLAAIKNPSVVFAKQANFANQQQVNNGLVSGQAPRAAKTESDQSELSGGTNELLPDARASQAAGRIDQGVEAVGKVDRAKV